MQRIVWGVVVGAAVAAVLAGSATANATGDTWSPVYDVNGAQLFVGPGQPSAAWELPASFTHGTGADATTLTGTDYITRSAGGFNDQFITNGGAVYDQDQLAPGFTNLYYDPSSTATAVDVMKTPFGNIDLSSMASSFAPADFSTVTGPAATYGENIVLNDLGGARIDQALGLVNNTVGYLWNGGPTDQSVITPLQTPESALVWEVPDTTFTQGTGADATTLTGTEYVTSPTDVEFVTNSGAVFDQNLWSGGLLTLANNIYYAPVDGPAEDFLQTAFGTFNLSSIASWFAPADVSGLVAPSTVTDLTDAGLYSALDLSLAS